MASARVSVGSDSDSGSELEMQDDFLGGSDDADDKNNGEGTGSGDGDDGSDVVEGGESYDEDDGSDEEGDDDDDGSDEEGEDDDDDGSDGKENGDGDDGSDEGGGAESYDDDIGSDEEGGTEDPSATSVSGITDVMAKILENAVPQAKSTILAKGQTDKQIRKRKKQKDKKDSTTEGKKEGDGSSSDDSDSDHERAKKRHLLLKKRKEWNDMSRMKPNVLSKEKERRLQKIATRGVVQIFNVVRQQQALVGEKLSEAGPSVRRRDKVLGAMSKKQFLDLLDHSQSKSKDNGAAKMDRGGKSQSDGTWNILRDDYMMKASMKDWDKDDDDNDNDDDR